LQALVPSHGELQILFEADNLTGYPPYTVVIDNVQLYDCEITCGTPSDCDDYCPSSSVSVSILPECPDDPLWSGFMTSGDMSLILERLSNCFSTSGIPGGEGDVDILFLTDSTGSLGGLIATVKAVFSPLVDAIQAQLPSVDFRWAVADYKDYEDGGAYASGWNVGQTFTASVPAAQAAIDAWSASGGGDTPEQNLSALSLAGSDWLTTLAGRAGAQKAVVWAGDVPGWENNAKGNGYPTLAATISSLVTAGVTVFGVNTEGVGTGIDAIGQTSGVGGPIDGRNQASAIVAATGGELLNNLDPSDTDTITEFLAEAIITTAGEPGGDVCEAIHGPINVEPSRTQNMDGAYVRSVNVANSERTRASRPQECRDYCWPAPEQDHYVSCECVVGDVRFKPGFNAAIRQDTANNAIYIDAEIGGGDGEPCDATPLYTGEGAPVGSKLLSGGPSCGEIVRTINGVGKRFFDIQGGQGVIVTPIPDEHKIVINVGLHDLALCADLPGEELAPCIGFSDDDCDCGPLISSISCVEPEVSSSSGYNPPVDLPVDPPEPSVCEHEIVFEPESLPAALIESSGDLIVSGDAGFEICPMSELFTPTLRLTATPYTNAVTRWQWAVTSGNNYRFTLVWQGLQGHVLYNLGSSFVTDPTNNVYGSGGSRPPSATLPAGDPPYDGSCNVVTSEHTFEALEDTLSLEFVARYYLSAYGRGIGDIGYICIEDLGPA